MNGVGYNGIGYNGIGYANSGDVFSNDDKVYHDENGAPLTNAIIEYPRTFLSVLLGVSTFLFFILFMDSVAKMKPKDQIPIELILDTLRQVNTKL